MRPVDQPLLPLQGWPLELAGALVVGAAFLLLFVLAEEWRRRRAPRPEWTRKLIHVGGGLICAFFPWLFATHWTVLVLLVALVLGLRVAKRHRLLPSLHAVPRSSKGEFYYPVGVYVLFVVARQQPVFYLIALTALVLADTVAALLGQRYGLVRFTAGEEVKSLEGSAAFMLATFLGVHLPLLLFTDLPRAGTVLVALQIALLVTSFEAISQHGNDNLIVPLVTYYLLLKMTPKPVESIAFQLLVQVAILVVALVMARRSRLLTFGGAVAVHLVLYGAFSLGGPGWIAAPALALAGILGLENWFRRGSGRARDRQQARAVFYVSIVPILLLFADNTFTTLVPISEQLSRGHPFFVPFVGALGGHIAIMAFQALRLRRAAPHTSSPALMWLGALVGFALVAPIGLLIGPDRLTLRAAIITASMCAASVPCYVAFRELVRRHGDPQWDFRFQALATTAAVLLVVPVHLWWVASR